MVGTNRRLAVSSVATSGAPTEKESLLPWTTREQIFCRGVHGLTSAQSPLQKRKMRMIEVKLNFFSSTKKAKEDQTYSST